MMTEFQEEVLEGLDAVVWEADPVSLQFTYVSRGAERLLGYSLDHWLQRPTFWADLLHPDDREYAVAYCRQAVADCRDHEFEYRMIAADGRVLWIRDIVRVVCDGSGSPASGLRGVMLDVSERKQAESALDRQDRLSHALIEHMLDIITVIDGDGVILYTSPSAERVLGREPGTRIGHRVFDDVHPEDIATARDAVHQAFTNRRPTPPVRLRYRHADGSWRLLEAIGRLFVDEGREVAIINSRDITERAALEEQGRQAQRMDALSRLTSAVAHDFNNVLFSIRSYVALAQQAADPAVVRRDLEEIQKAVDLGTALTTQLKTFGDRRPVAPEVIDVHDTVAQFDALLRRLLGPDVTVEQYLDAPVARVRLCRGQFEQVLMNLAVNARQAMPAGGRFEVRTQVDPWGATHADGTFGDLIVEVIDSGTGIAPEIVGHIFDPYFTTKPHSQGSGLGLSTVYGIVHDAGGTIAVRSAVGQGATFTIRLPLA